MAIARVQQPTLDREWVFTHHLALPTSGHKVHMSCPGPSVYATVKHFLSADSCDIN